MAVHPMLYVARQETLIRTARLCGISIVRGRPWYKDMTISPLTERSVKH
jgi:hypothetical protein